MTAVFVNEVVTFAPSTLITIVSGFTPESLSVTLNLIAGVAFVIYAPAVGYVKASVGATFSRTRSNRFAPKVASL